MLWYVGLTVSFGCLLVFSEDMDAESAVEVVKLMDTGEFECFVSLSELAIRRIHGFAASEALFVQLIQVLFTDRVAHRLCSLELSGINQLVDTEIHFDAASPSD